MQCSRCHDRSNVHPPAHSFRALDTPVVLRPDIAPTPALPGHGMDFIIGRDVPVDQIDPNAPPAVHRNVVCDNCSEDIIGERNKCVDCNDYDLCSGCIGGMRTFHNQAHRFFTMCQPNRIVIHTVDDLFNPPTAPMTADLPRPSASAQQLPQLDAVVSELRSVLESGREVVNRAAAHVGEPLTAVPSPRGRVPLAPLDSSAPTQVREAQNLISEMHVLVANARAVLARAEAHAPVEHAATCDLCDSLVIGLRWKCLDCPDWDACEACYTIVPEQHPGHRFVKIESKDQLSPVASTLRQPKRHRATCDGCQNQIYDVRFKVRPVLYYLVASRSLTMYSACTRAARTLTSARAARRSRSRFTRRRTRC